MVKITVEFLDEEKIDGKYAYQPESPAAPVKKIETTYDLTDQSSTGDFAEAFYKIFLLMGHYGVDRFIDPTGSIEIDDFPGCDGNCESCENEEICNDNDGSEEPKKE